MFQSITFYVGEKTLGIYGEEFPLGALTTEVLNITPEEYQALDSRLQSAMEGMARYEKTHTLTDWHQANEQMLRLNEALCRHRIFRLIQTDAYILTEAKQLTEMPIAEGDPLEMDAHDHEILRQICAYEDYLENPKKYGRIKNPEELSEAQREWYLNLYPPIPPKPEAKTPALLIAPVPLDLKWQMYKAYCMNYAQVLKDVASVCQTLRAFIRESLSTLEHLSPNQYIAALNGFLFPEFRHKWIANPIEGTGNYTLFDDVCKCRASSLLLQRMQRRALAAQTKKRWMSCAPKVLWNFVSVFPPGCMTRIAEN